MPRNPKYDAVLPVGPSSAKMARHCAAALLRFLEPERIFVVGCPQVLATTRRWRLPRIELVEEDSLVPEITLQILRDMQSAAGRNPDRAGWYLQQFIKMGMALREDLHEHYLVWDSDTVLLRPLDFFTPDGRVLISFRALPVMDSYRILAEALLGEPIPGADSCIREQMMIRKSWMREMLERIEATGKDGQSWAIRVMSENLSRAQPEQWFQLMRKTYFRNYGGIWDFGFSEFETYASFLRLHHADDIAFRKVHSHRAGASDFGFNPNRFDFEYLSHDFDYVSFESWAQIDPRLVRKNKRRAIRCAIKRRLGA